MRKYIILSLLASCLFGQEYRNGSVTQVGATNYFSTETGSGNTYTVPNTTPAITSYVAGATYTFAPSHNNSGASTFQIGSLGAKAIFKGQITALSGGEIVSGSGATITVLYDGTQFEMQSQTANGGGSSVPTLPAGVTFMSIYAMNEGTGFPTDSSGNGRNEIAHVGTCTWVTGGLLITPGCLIEYPVAACNNAETIYISMIPPINRTTTVTTPFEVVWSSFNYWLGWISSTWNAPVSAFDGLVEASSGERMVGLGSFAWVQPNILYVNGNPVSLRLTGSINPWTAANYCALGGINTSAPGSSFGTIVTGIYNATTVLTQAQIAQLKRYDDYQLQLKGLGSAIGQGLNRGGSVIIDLGDSITYGYAQVNGNQQSAARNGTPTILEALDLGSGQSVPIYNLGKSGETANQMNSDVSLVESIAQTYQGENLILDLMGGTNDITSSTSAATIEGYLNAICTTVVGFGMKCIDDTIMPSSDMTSPQLTVRTTLNAALISTWLAGGSHYAWIADVGGDPIMGTMGLPSATSLGAGTWFDNESSVYKHPLAIGNAIMAARKTQAVLNVIAPGKPHTLKVSVPYQVFNVLNSGTSTQLINLYQLGPNEIVNSITATWTNFTGSSLTALNYTLGDSGAGGSVTSYDSTGTNLFVAEVNPRKVATTFASVNGVVTVSFTAGGSDVLNTLTAGNVNFDITTTVQP
jgi:hypothetical protein